MIHATGRHDVIKTNFPRQYRRTYELQLTFSPSIIVFVWSCRRLFCCILSRSPPWSAWNSNRSNTIVSTTSDNCYRPGTCTCACNGVDYNISHQISIVATHTILELSSLIWIMFTCCCCCFTRSTSEVLTNHVQEQDLRFLPRGSITLAHVQNLSRTAHALESYT